MSQIYSPLPSPIRRTYPYIATHIRVTIIILSIGTSNISASIIRLSIVGTVSPRIHLNIACGVLKPHLACTSDILKPLDLMIFLILLPVAFTSIIGIVSNSFLCIMKTKTPPAYIQTVFIICMDHNTKKVFSEMTIHYVYLYAAQIEPLHSRDRNLLHSVRYTDRP